MRLLVRGHKSRLKRTGDADRDLVAIMKSLDHGAVDMVRAEIKYGHSEQLRQLAQEIIVARETERLRMNGWVSFVSP